VRTWYEQMTTPSSISHTELSNTDFVDILIMIFIADAVTVIKRLIVHALSCMISDETANEASVSLGPGSELAHYRIYRSPYLQAWPVLTSLLTFHCIVLYCLLLAASVANNLT